MNLERIKVSSRTTHLFGMLKTTTCMGAEPWARLSLCLSLGQSGIPNPDEYNRDGTEFAPSQLFGRDEKLYLALLLDRLLQDGLDPETYLNEMARAHLNRGAISLKQRVGSLSDMYGFMDEMRIGGLGSEGTQV